MEVALDRDQFLKGLQMVQNIVEPRQTLPILANVLSLKLGDNASVSLRCAGVSYKLVGLAADDFPPVVPASPASWLTLDAKTLREMLTHTSFAVSHDETRYALNGVLFAIQPKEMRVVATDGHRLAIASRALPQETTPATGIVPRKAVAEIQRALGAGEEVQIALTDNQFVLQMPNFVMTARLIEGQFPNYEAVIPKAQPGKLAMSRLALIAALRRVAVMAEERNKPVKLTLAPTSLKLSASSSELGEAEEALTVDYAGDEVTIAFNSRYILDALSPLDEDAVVFEFKDALSPGVVKTAADDDYRCVIMPMRI